MTPDKLIELGRRAPLALWEQPLWAVTDPAEREARNVAIYDKTQELIARWQSVKSRMVDICDSLGVVADGPPVPVAIIWEATTGFNHRAHVSRSGRGFVSVAYNRTDLKGKVQAETDEVMIPVFDEPNANITATLDLEQGGWQRLQGGDEDNSFGWDEFDDNRNDVLTLAEASIKNWEETTIMLPPAIANR